MKQDDILTKYNNEMSRLRYQFPIDAETLKQNHKSILSKILPDQTRSSLSSSIQKQIDSSFANFQNENEEKYINKLTSYLEKEYSHIKSNIDSNSYTNISDYISDLTLFQNKVNSGAENGPNKSLHINEFILEQILNDLNSILDFKKSNYDSQFNDKKKEIDQITEEIQQTKDACKKLLLNIKENENIIKQIESDKNFIIKQSTSNSDKISKTLKMKADIIYKLNQQIEDIENKQNNIINDLKEKINIAKNKQIEKDKTAGNSKTEFETKKIELQTRIDFLEKQIKNVNETRTNALKSLANDLLGSTRDSELKKFEEQISSLNKKIEKLSNKNNELTEELMEKEALLEKEKNKSINLVNEYEKKLKSVSEDHDYIENKANEIQNEENNNIQQLKMNYETQIAELKGNFSKDELIVKTNINKLTSLIKKTSDEIASLKIDYDKSVSKLNDFKSQNDKDKIDHSNYVKILEENHKRIMSQYDECVKENNFLKQQHKSQIIHLNGETEKKIVEISKDSEKIQSEIVRKKKENEQMLILLEEKFQELEKLIPNLKAEQDQLQKEINDISVQKDSISNDNEKEIDDIKLQHEKEIEALKQQCVEDLENNKVQLQNNLDFAEKECEQQKEELLQKMKENEEINNKNQEELLNMYNEKIKILEQVKNEKIEDLNNEIEDINNVHQDYVEQTDEEMNETENEINGLNSEIEKATEILNRIQSDHDIIVKQNNENFKKERNELERILEELLKRYNKTFVTISLSQKENDNLNENINRENDSIEKLKNNLNDLKNRKEGVISDLNSQIKDLNIKLMNGQNEFNEKSALKDQEISYLNDQIDENQKDLNEFQKSYNEKIEQCKNKLIEQFKSKYDELKAEKDELESNYNEKKKDYKELESNFNSQIAILCREKEVLNDKFTKVTEQIEEVESNLKLSKNNNYIKIENLKSENNDRMNQLMKENEALRNKLSGVQADFNELSEVYEKDKTLWNNKYNHLLDDKKTIETELFNFKNKYNSNIDDLTQKLQNDRINLQQIYDDAIKKRDEKFNTQINNANKLFAQKFEYINNLNQFLTLKNNELIGTLNNYEAQLNTKDKEAKLAVALQSIQRYKKDINELNNTKDKNIEELESKIISERKEFTTKIIQLQKKLRDYEIKRSTFSANVLKQNVSSEKDSDEQSLLITRLKNQILALEKANFRLQIDNRDTAKDNKNLRRRSRESKESFIPKSRITTSGKENVRIISNLPRETLNLQKKNLLDKFNKQKFENEDFNIGSNSGSVILNSSYIEENSGKKKI